MPAISMPLFQFEMRAAPGFSLGYGFSIERFQFSDTHRIALFSEQDIWHMLSARWALVHDGDEPDGYKAQSNAILMGFRVLSERQPPFIKFRLSSAPEQSTRIQQPMTYNYAANRERGAYSAQELDRVRSAFRHMQAMDAISTRTHNALYFLYRAFHADKWIDSFLLMTSALEALFSKDAPGGATAAITTRVASFLGSADRCTKKDLEELYDLRSQMTHGRIAVGDDAGDNLAKLEHLEHVTNAAIRKLLESQQYLRFETKAGRDVFMGTLNVAL